MKLLKGIPEKFAAGFLLLQIVLITVFHVLVLLNVISFKLVWGGRIESRNQLVVMESISFFVNVFLFWIIAQRGAYFRKQWSDKNLRVTLYIMSFMFLLNTLGNAVAIHAFEKYVFGSLTFVSSIFCLRLAIKDN